MRRWMNVRLTGGLVLAPVLLLSGCPGQCSPTRPPVASPAPTQTLPPGGPGCGFASAAFCEEFAAPGPTTGNRNGALDTARFSVSRWKSESPRGVELNVSGGPTPPNDVTIENGRAVIDVGMQNYGDVVARVNQLFDFADGGTITFDTSLYRASDLWGWPTVQLLADPYNAPSYDDDNSRGPLPREGLTVHFQLECGAPIVRQYHDHNETDDRSADSFRDCTQLRTAEGQLNRVEMRISQNRLEICASDAGSTALRQCWQFPVNLRFTRGFVYFGGHNHATVKYGGPPSWTTYWDNVGFDGPVVPASAVSQVPNASGAGFSYPLGSTFGPALVVPNVNLRASARLVLNVAADAISNGDHAAWRLNYRLNGGTAHSVPFTPTPDPTRGGSYIFSIPVDPSELSNGNNSVQFSATGFTGGYAPFIGNIDLVTQ